MGIVVGGNDAWKVHKAGELVVAFHWVGSGGEDPEPTMCLYPAIPSRKAGVVMIGLSSAHRYADSKSGDPLPYLVQQTPVFANHMGMVLTSGTLRKIADAVVDFMPDLLRMPPEPPELDAIRRAKEGKAGDLSIIANGETIMEASV